MATVAKLNVQIGADLKDFQKGMAQAQRGLADFGKKMTAVGAGLTKTLTLPIVGFLGASTRAFTKQEDAERKLAAAIGATGGAVDSNMKRFKAFASEMQRLTVVGDETVLSLLQIATAQGLSAESSERAAKNAIALQSAFGVGAESAIRMTAALEQGDATMLRRYIPALRGVEDNAMAVVKAQEILTGAFSIAEAEALTFGGQVSQLKMSFGDLMEQIGEIVAEAINPFVKRLKEIVKQVQQTDKETLKFYITLGAIAAAIGPVLIGLGAMAKGLVAVKALLLFTYANPYVLVTAGVVALAGYYATLISRINRTNKMLGEPIDKSLPIDDQIQSAIQRVEALDKRVANMTKNVGVGTTTASGVQAQRGQLENAENQLNLERQRLVQLIAQRNANVANTNEQEKQLKTLTEIIEKTGALAENPFKPIVGMNIQDDIIYPFKQLNFELMNLDQLMSTNLDNFEELETVPLNLSSNFEILQPIIDNFVNSFAQGMANVVMQGEKLQDVLKNIGKLLLSSAIQFAISALLTGGVGTGTGFFGKGGGIFGSLFGGATPVNDALIQSNGNIVKFHPDDNILAMKDFSNFLN
jgi:hypothetical protein